MVSFRPFTEINASVRYGRADNCRKGTRKLRARTQLQTGYEKRRLETNHWTGVTQRTRNESCGYYGKWTSFLPFRVQLRIGCEDEWSAFDPLPKLTQASDTDVRIIVGKERESYEPELNYTRIRGRALRNVTF